MVWLAPKTTITKFAFFPLSENFIPSIADTLSLVKHETRIRTLETKTKDQEKQLVSQGILLNNNGHGDDMDPDEV